MCVYMKNLPECEQQIPGASPKISSNQACTQLSLKASFGSGTPYDKTSKKWNENEYNYVSHSERHETNSNCGEGRFQKVDSNSRPKIRDPESNTSACLPELYPKCWDRVANEIRNAAFFSTTVDLWPSRTTKPYISLPIHYIDDNWKLQIKSLQTSYFPDNHTREIIAVGLRGAFSSWGLKESRQVCMTTDSGLNMIKALELNKWTRLGCFRHRLHIAIGKF